MCVCVCVYICFNIIPYLICSIFLFHLLCSRCTSWSHILANNSGHYLETKSQAIHAHLKTRYKITPLSDYKYNRRDILHRLDKYFKFLVVRHPLDRLASGYRDKLAGNNSLYENRFRPIILNRLHQHRSKIKTKNRLSFHDYIEFVTVDKLSNAHFKSYQHLCYPCQIKYDYVAKLETHSKDADYIIEKHLSGIGIGASSKFHSKRGGAKMVKELKEYNDLLYDYVKQVAVVYGEDMDMFGYTIKQDKDRVVGRCGGMASNECC